MSSLSTLTGQGRGHALHGRVMSAGSPESEAEISSLGVKFPRLVWNLPRKLAMQSHSRHDTALEPNHYADSCRCATKSLSCSRPDGRNEIGRAPESAVFGRAYCGARKCFSSLR